jgi:hypothetical protein
VAVIRRHAPTVGRREVGSIRGYPTVPARDVGHPVVNLCANSDLLTGGAA